MEEGKIILVVFPQDPEKKLRPALILRAFPKYGDLLVCGITSRTSQFIPDFDILLDENHPYFLASGLKISSIFRLNMLTMLAAKNIAGTLGALDHATHFSLLKNLSDYLLKDATS